MVCLRKSGRIIWRGRVVMVPVGEKWVDAGGVKGAVVKSNCDGVNVPGGKVGGKGRSETSGLCVVRDPV